MMSVNCKNRTERNKKGDPGLFHGIMTELFGETFRTQHRTPPTSYSDMAFALLGCYAAYLTSVLLPPPHFRESQSVPFSRVKAT